MSISYSPIFHSFIKYMHRIWAHKLNLLVAHFYKRWRPAFSVTCPGSTAYLVSRFNLSQRNIYYAKFIRHLRVVIEIQHFHRPRLLSIQDMLFLDPFSSHVTNLVSCGLLFLKRYAGKCQVLTRLQYSSLLLIFFCSELKQPACDTLITWCDRWPRFDMGSSLS